VLDGGVLLPGSTVLGDYRLTGLQINGIDCKTGSESERRKIYTVIQKSSRYSFFGPIPILIVK